MTIDMKEYKHIRHIYPVGNYFLSQACYSCGGDVDCGSGFVDMLKPPSKSYLCAKCAMVSIGSIKCAELQMFAQEASRSRGHHVKP